MLARLSVSHPRRVLVAVVLFVALAGFVGGPLAGSLDGGGSGAPASAESQAAVRQLEAATGVEPSAGLVLLVDAPGSARATAERLQRLPGVADARVAATRGDRSLVTGTLRADADEDDTAQAVVDAFADTAGVTVGGAAVAGLQITEQVQEDLGRAELLAFPLLIALSLLFFRGRAALLPLIAGLTTVLGTFLVLTGVNQVYGLSVFALNLVIGLGLGLAIDYTLLLVTRFREELARNVAEARSLRRAPGETRSPGAAAGITRTDVVAAVRTTFSTAGRTIVFSAATVATALATLTVFEQGFLKSMGIAGAVVAVVAALASLVVTPALCAIWGAKLLPRGTRVARQERADARWYRFAHAVMRRPGAVAVVTTLVMVALAVPATTVTWSPIDARTVPAGQSARVVDDASRADFGGAAGAPVTVAVQAPREDAAAVAAYARRIAAVDGVTRVIRPVAVSGDLWQIDAVVAGSPSGAVAQHAVADVRALDPAFAARVTGPAALFVDQQGAIRDRLVPAIALLAALTFLVLFALTGSVVLPLKAIVMNVLTVGAALAPLVLVYQGGRLAGVLGYTPNGGVEPTDFVVTATLVFALSTDYGVFLLGRIKEARDTGTPEREAVAAGLAATGRVVTAAAVLLAVAIGAFATSQISFIQQIGVAVATGVLVDAFVVRSLLVPSLMALLGRWNWWAPRPLRRLHAPAPGVRDPATGTPAAANGHA